MQAELLAAIPQADEIVLGVDSDAEIDLSFLQLLIATHRSAAACGKRVELQMPPAGAFAQALKDSGFLAAPGVTSLGQIFAPHGGRT